MASVTAVVRTLAASVMETLLIRPRALVRAARVVAETPPLLLLFASTLAILGPEVAAGELAGCVGRGNFVSDTHAGVARQCSC